MMRWEPGTIAEALQQDFGAVPGLWALAFKVAFKGPEREPGVQLCLRLTLLAEVVVQ